MTIQTTSEIYLDNNATTQPLPEVIEAVAQHLGESFGNPGSRHAAGRRARVVLEDSRETIARILGADPGEVIFTSGGTESTNLALFGLSAGNPGLVLTIAGEHPATTESITALAERGWSSRPLQVDQDGRLLPDELTTLPWEDIRLATVILAHNETGVVQDLDPLSKACRERSTSTGWEPPPWPWAPTSSMDHVVSERCCCGTVVGWLRSNTAGTKKVGVGREPKWLHLRLEWRGPWNRGTPTEPLAPTGSRHSVIASRPDSKSPPVPPWSTDTSTTACQTR